MNIDRFIAGFQGTPDGDLVLCSGVAYQADREHRVTYGGDYFDKCGGYEGSAIAEAINAERIALVDRHYGNGKVIDIGVGSGEFIKRRPNTYGYDVNPVAEMWLRDADRWSSSLGAFKAFTMWDVIEHVPDPGVYLDRVPVGGFVFTSIPVFDDFRQIRLSKHYRPGEHLQYWSVPGFIEWMSMHGFEVLESNDQETRAGRESIWSFAFRRRAWPT